MTYATCMPQQSLFSPGVNIYENAGEVLLEVELPGRKREEVSVEVSEGTLKISAPDALVTREGFEAIARECRRGAFERSFRLGADLQADTIKARFENGLLLLSIAKHEKAQARKVDIA